MKRKAFSIILIVLSLYILSYIGMRQTHTEVWEKDGNSYLIFPEDKVFYYIFRPLSYLDGKITGLKFHIGKHR